MPFDVHVQCQDMVYDTVLMENFSAVSWCTCMCVDKAWYVT